jgi:predicted nucleic acid-binding Zn ribbon protein
MPTYLYETVPPDGAAAEQFEWRQSMTEAPLARHPQTGVPVRRVISGGLGHVSRGERSLPVAEAPGCGPGTCNCGRF